MTTDEMIEELRDAVREEMYQDFYDRACEKLGVGELVQEWIDEEVERRLALALGYSTEDETAEAA